MIDIARFYGIALVYYGHFIERVMYLKNPVAAAHYKFIYSFHMLLFFVLAGYISKESDLEFSFGKYLKHRFFSRLIPFIFFTGFMIGLTFFFSGDFFQLKLPSISGYLQGLLLTIFGLPMFNVPTWFLLCLFSVEMVHYGAFRFLKSDSKIFIGAVVFYVIGYVLNWKIDFFNPMKQRVIGWNYLYIHEAVTVYSFYLLGIYFRRKKFLMENVALTIQLPGVIITFLIVLFTYKLNQGPFVLFNSVIIMFSSHGNFLLFPLTAVAGSVFILFLAKATPSLNLVAWLGQNALILFCLNGIFYHFINGRAAQWLVDNLSGTPLTLFGAGCLVTLASLALCIPFILLFNKFVPQLVGKPKVSGPWLKNFI
jgi:acyltransferase